MEDGKDPITLRDRKFRVETLGESPRTGCQGELEQEAR